MRSTSTGGTVAAPVTATRSEDVSRGVVAMAVSNDW